MTDEMRDRVVYELRRQTQAEMLVNWCKRTGISLAHATRVLSGVDHPSARICSAVGSRFNVSS
jgi:hypothetical protein